MVVWFAGIADLVVGTASLTGCLEWAEQPISICSDSPASLCWAEFLSVEVKIFNEFTPDGTGLGGHS